MKYLMKIAYDGTLYKGWQYQENLTTVQGTIEKQLRILLKENISLFAAGRTDAGVHACCQFTHFETERLVNIDKLRYSLNCLLKNDTIVILEIKSVDSSFHARFSCLMKEYRYQILLGHTHDVFLNNRYWLVPRFNVEVARLCGKLLCGSHDFSSLRDSQCQAASPIRSIESCEFFQNGNLITMAIKAKSFLHHQIRITVGTIFEITAKEQKAERILEILEKKDRTFAGMTAPARGLFLYNIWY